MYNIKNKKIAIFDFYLGGHHIEYLHHIYIHAIENHDIDYIFILPNNFSMFKSDFVWPESNNVEFIFYELDDSYIRSLRFYDKSRKLCNLLKHFINEYNLEDVILIETIAFMPFLPFFISNKVRITSIMYHLPLFSKESTLKERLLTNINMSLIAHSKCFNRICILNSTEAVEFYNKKYNKHKFHFLPDPYTPIECKKDKKDIRQSFGISNESLVFIHFGGLTKRKGTLEILDALINIDCEKLKNKCFIFAGRVIEDIREEFYNKLEILKNKVQIIIIDKFCSYSLLAEICEISDFIIIPYKNTAQSSGVCSYAAQFKKPVIGTAEGLLGSLIRNNGLGYTIYNIDYKKIAELIYNEEYKNIRIDHTKSNIYLNTNTPKNFYHHLTGL